MARQAKANGEHVASLDGVAPRCLVAPSEAASVALAGKIVPGCWLLGLTKGQFSLLDLIRAVLNVTGPADVRLSTWSSGIRDAETAAWLLREGRFKSLRLYTDRSFPSRHPAYAARLVHWFGADAIRCTRIHAKVATIKADAWRLLLRSSMNLNRNPRFEQFDLNDSPEACAFMDGWLDDLDRLGAPGIEWEGGDAERAYNEALEGGRERDAQVVAEMTGTQVASALWTPDGAAPAVIQAPAPPALGLTGLPTSPVEVAQQAVARLELAVRLCEPSGATFLAANAALRGAYRDLEEARERAW